MELRDQLQSSLGTRYELERELGGGGMSHVFIAHETALGRRVVVKVLPPELGAGVSAERFSREIRLAASLQQANIVPVLSAGDVNGLPFYTMPFIEGESLRARLASAGALPIAEVRSLLRDVARALAYAHERGIVHRDIKPDNVLVSGGAAVVTDFGIAKAVERARRDDGERRNSDKLTAFGVSVGTPAYMAPEQVIGDPEVDHRADIYSFGVMAYELLTNRLPFDAHSSRDMLSAHVYDAPPPVTELRPDVPPTLAALVMRCLAKAPGERPANAAELVRALDTLSTDEGLLTMPAILLGGRGMLRKALAAYVIAFLAVALVARAAIVAIGLPDWVFPGALLVMALGLPVILFTAYVQYEARRVATRTPTVTPGGSPVASGTMATVALRAGKHVSWRRTTIGGIYALGAFVLLVVGFMTLRALGIGPAGSLLAAGRLTEQDRLIVTDFRALGPDSTLGSVVAEAVRTNLAQSNVVSVLQPRAVAASLARMQRPPGATVDLAVAREIAAREGIKGIIDGEIRPLGAGFLVSVRLVGADSGEELASYRETAESPKDLIPTIDRVARDLRGRMGESLRAVRASPPLEQVTTPSLEALRRYALGKRAIETEDDFGKGSALLEDAIGLDTGFAMAYRKLAIEVQNRGGQRARAATLLARAYAHRDRLTELERQLTTAAYFTDGPAPDEDRARAAYESALAIDQNNYIAVNNLGLIYESRREFGKALQQFERSRTLDSTTIISYSNLAGEQYRVGQTARAFETLRHGEQRWPAAPVWNALRQAIYEAGGNIDSATAINARVRGRPLPDVLWKQRLTRAAAGLLILQGRLREARPLVEEAHGYGQQRGVASAPLRGAIELAQIDAWYLGDSARALRRVDEALTRYPLDSLAPTERPLPELVGFYQLVGRPERAQSTLAALERALGNSNRADDQATLHEARGEVALAAGQVQEAVRELRDADRGSCTNCVLGPLARAYDRAGQPDSAIATYERLTTARDIPRWFVDQWQLAPAYKRLGELYEAKGDRQKALGYYLRFAELWKRADPELQPAVADVKQRIARLAAAEESSHR